MTPEEYYGGAIDASFGSNAVLSWNRTARLVTLTMTAGSLTVTLPAASTVDMPYGRRVLILVNVGTNSFDVLGGLYGTITLAQDEALFCSKVDNNGTPAMMTTRFAVL